LISKEFQKVAATPRNMICDMEGGVGENFAMQRNRLHCAKVLSITKIHIVDIAHSDRRLVQFWVEAGALRPTAESDRQGRGRHRQFSRDELIIACLLTALSYGRTPIGLMIRFAEGMRSVTLPHQPGRKLIEAAIADTKNVFVAFIDDLFINVMLIDDPTAKEALEFFMDMLRLKKRGTTNRRVIYANPWFENLRG
jgi:hypothetical protein